MRELAFLGTSLSHAGWQPSCILPLSRVVIKLTAILLTFLFTLGSPGIAAAATAEGSAIQDTTVATVPISESPTETTTVVPIREESKASGVDSVAEPAAAPVTTDAAVADSKAKEPAASATSSTSTEDASRATASSPKSSLPEADPSTGALVYRYPLVIPPGRKGLLLQHLNGWAPGLAALCFVAHG